MPKINIILDEEDELILEPRDTKPAAKAQTKMKSTAYLERRQHEKALKGTNPRHDSNSIPNLY